MLTQRKSFAIIAITLLMTLFSIPMTIAHNHILSAPEALKSLQAEEIVILDIRSRDEWRKTGVATGAWPVSMHEPTFGAFLSAILKQYPPEKIALICATGGRTSFVIQHLSAQGIVGVKDIAEGMMGSGGQPGWIARELPISTLEDAGADFNAQRAGWTEN